MHRRLLIACLLAAGCGPDQELEYDLEPIVLARAPVEPGGSASGALLATVTGGAGVEPLLIDTAFPFNSLARNGCGAGAPAGWTYRGDLDLRDGGGVAVRARFRSIDLFDLCPGATGDASVQPIGVIGGPLLTNFVVGLDLPRVPGPAAPTTMTLWPGLPGTDDQLAQAGWSTMTFKLRGGAVVGPTGGEASVTLPNSRIVLSACAVPRSFSPTEPVETCARGEVALKATGVDLLLAVGTGAGPLVLSDRAWAAIAARLGVAPETGTAGLLYTAFSTAPIPALYVDVPRLALLQGTTDNDWLGACTELARARRIEWVLANQPADPTVQDPNVCFQPCDARGRKAANTRSYLELGGTLRAAVVNHTSDLIRSLNADAPPNPQIDGMVGAATLAGTRLRLDYLDTPAGRVVAACDDDSPRELCWAAPSCPALSSQGQRHRCFGQTVDRGWAPVCPQ